MLRLGPSQTLQVLLGGAVSATQADVVVCFTDIAPSFPKGFQTQVRLKTTSGASAVDICEAPDAATTREIDFISLRNNDSASITATIRIHDSGGTSYKLIVVTLLTLEQLQFTADSGWVVKDTSGRTKTSVAGTDEGVWTPVVTFATKGDLSVTYSTQAGTYTKSGRLVVAHYHILTSAFTHSTASGNLNVTGLPFTAGGANSQVGSVFWGGITKASYTQIVGRVSGTLILFTASGSGVAASNVVATDVPSAGTVRLEGTAVYYV